MLPLLAVGAARLLATLRPGHLRTVLELARRGARPATRQQAQAAREAVVAVSLRCAGKGCLQRSIAATLYCRAHGTWPTWCTGVRTNPFAATPGSKSMTNPSANPTPPATTDPSSPSHPRTGGYDDETHNRRRNWPTPASDAPIARASACRSSPMQDRPSTSGGWDRCQFDAISIIFGGYQISPGAVPISTISLCTDLVFSVPLFRQRPGRRTVGGLAGAIPLGGEPLPQS
ncbi:MAG: lasso peptide biosynthesis B2 protein [Pseudonocardiaceae bacterium]